MFSGESEIPSFSLKSHLSHLAMCLFPQSRLREACGAAWDLPKGGAEVPLPHLGSGHQLPGAGDLGCIPFPC
jgi:hypothetical protein